MTRDWSKLTLRVGTTVRQFEVWDIREPTTCILVVEGEDCEEDLGLDINPGVIVGKHTVIDMVRFGP